MSVSVSSLFPVIRKKYSFIVTSLKPEQNNVIERVVANLAKEDDFAFYPTAATGFGKSLMYLVPFVSDLVSLHNAFCVRWSEV